MASLQQLYQELSRTRSRRANPRAILAAAGEKAQGENERRWGAERQAREEFYGREQERKIMRMAEQEQSDLRIKRIREQEVARIGRERKLEKEEKTKERHEDYQAAIYGIEAGLPELANRYMSKYGPEDVTPTFAYDQETKQFKLSHPGRDLAPTDMERVGGKWQMKDVTLKPAQAKSLLEKFQSVEGYRASQTRKTAAAKERRAEMKTGIDVGEYKLKVGKFQREGQQGLSDKDKLKMFGFYQKDRAAGTIDPDYTFDDYLAEAGIGGARMGIPEPQQAGGVPY